MRVLHIVDEWLPVTQNWLGSSIRHLPPSVESIVVCRRPTGESIPGPAGLIHVPFLAGGLVGRAVDVLLPSLEPARLARRLDGQQADVLHAHFGTAGWDGRAAAARLRKPLVVSFYGFDVDSLPRPRQRWRERYRRIFDEAALLLALGPEMAGRLGMLGADPGRLVVHHLGVPAADLAFRSRSWAGDRPVRVLIASSFRPKKGIPLAIEALGRIRQRVPVRITLVGDASKGREQVEKRRIVETITRLGMGDIVHQTGFVSHADLIGLAYEQDVLVAASMTAPDGDSEGTPMTLVELAATGIIAVTTRHADIPEIVNEGKSGFLAEPGNLESFVAALERAIAGVDRWPAIGMAARAHAIAEFDAATQGRRLAGLYDRVSR